MPWLRDILISFDHFYLGVDSAMELYYLIRRNATLLEHYYGITRSRSGRRLSWIQILFTLTEVSLIPFIYRNAKQKIEELRDLGQINQVYSLPSHMVLANIPRIRRDGKF